MLGGLLLVISSTDPPELQIRILRDEVVPGATLPKSRSKLLAGSHPPSVVPIDNVAIAAVEADPCSVVVSLPPVVQIVK